MAFAPLLVTGAAAILGGIKQQQSDNYNAAVMKNEQSFSINQAAGQENIVRRNSREALGKQAAAFGGAGVGYGGSSETALDQSAVNQELDALNTRYKGAITGYGYGVQSDILKQQGKDAVASSVLMAGGSALKGLGSMYSFMPQTPSAMAGTGPMGPPAP